MGALGFNVGRDFTRWFSWFTVNAFSEPLNKILIQTRVNTKVYSGDTPRLIQRSAYSFQLHSIEATTREVQMLQADVLLHEMNDVLQGLQALLSVAFY